MTKKKKILLWVMTSILSLALILGIGFVVISNSQDELPNLSQGELMAQLNGQITEMSSDELNDAIDDFQNTIDRYGYPLALVSIEVNGKIEKIEVLLQGNSYTLPKLGDTETQYFKGWRINGKDKYYYPDESLNVSTSVKFVADMANKAVVRLMVNDKVYGTEYTIPGNSISLPDLQSLQTDTHYCVGWQVNGQTVSSSDYTVWQDVTIVADMQKKVVVTYMVDGEVWKTQNIIPSTEVRLPTVSDTDTKFYTGWKVDGVGSSYITYYVEEDVTFVVDFSDTGWVQTQDYNNISFIYSDSIWTDGEHTYYSRGTDQYVLNGDTWEEKTWTGLTSFGGSNIWTDGEHTYYSSGTVHYVLNGDTWGKKTWTGLTSFTPANIWTDGEHTYYSYGTDQYVLNGDTWEEKTWTGLTSFSCENRIWTDGEHTYYSRGTDQYVLNGDTWEEKIWTGLTSFHGISIWTDVEHTYYSSGTGHYVLNGDTWEAVTWNGLTSFDGKDIWTAGEHIYYSSRISGSYEAYKKLNLVTKTWEQVFPKGLTFSYVYANMYSVGDVCYYSNKNTCLVTNKTTRTWEEMTWNGLTSFYGGGIWTDGEHTYYSFGTDQYVLNGDTWEEKTWSGLTSLTPANIANIWTDGEHTYFSEDLNHYILNGDTWERKTWTGLTRFDGKSIWTDGEHTYYSYLADQYVLNGDTWEEKTWNGLTSFHGTSIWTDGEHILCTYSNDYYLLNVDTHEWKMIGYKDGGQVYSSSAKLWTDGNNIYACSSLNKIYLFDKDTCKWVETTWRGLKTEKKFFWTDGINHYCFTERGIYKLTKYN